MATGDNYSKYRTLSVHIFLNDTNERVLGSGVLFVRGMGKEALVFTAAHVFPNIRSENEFKLCFSINDNGTIRKIEDTFYDKHSVGEGIKNRIYYLDSFDESDLTSDAAIITVPWEDWMVEYQPFDLQSDCLENAVIGWGYPEAMNRRTSQGNKYYLLSPIEGKITPYDSESICWMYLRTGWS